MHDVIECIGWITIGGIVIWVVDGIVTWVKRLNKLEETLKHWTSCRIQEHTKEVMAAEQKERADISLRVYTLEAKERKRKKTK